MHLTFPSTHGHIAYTDSGGGDKTLILLHGLPTSKELWSPVLPLLRPDFRIITFDLNDYGQSQKIGQPISHKQRADVLDELRAHLGLERFHLIAHDLGASVAVDYMGKYGARVQKLVLLSPPVYPDFVEPAIVKLVRVPVLGEILVLLLKPFLFKIGVGQGMAHKQRLTPDLLAAFSDPFTGPTGRAALLRILRWGRPAHVFADYPRIIRSIPTPTLVIQGRQDPYIPLEHAARLADDIPDARLLIIEDGSHFLPIDTPAAVAEALNHFL